MHKYMSDGRKVVVIGQLNTVESIVQEIFVTEQGDEIPSGERFTTKDLHDTPVISYKKKEEIKLEETIAKLKQSKDILYNEIEKMKEQRKVNAALLKASDSHIKTMFNDEQTFDLFADVVAGNIEYATQDCNFDYLCDIVPFEEAISRTRNDYYNVGHFEEIKLLSLFGCADGDLCYRLYDYRDDSGTRRKFKFFRNKQEVIKYLEEYMEKKDVLREYDLPIIRKFMEIPQHILDKTIAAIEKSYKDGYDKSLQQAKDNLNKNLEKIRREFK